MSSGSFRNIFNNIFTNLIYVIYIYKQNLECNNLRGLISHKTQSNQTDPLARIV